MATIPHTNVEDQKVVPVGENLEAFHTHKSREEAVIKGSGFSKSFLMFDFSWHGKSG